MLVRFALLTLVAASALPIVGCSSYEPVAAGDGQCGTHVYRRLYTGEYANPQSVQPTVAAAEHGHVAGEQPVASR